MNILVFDTETTGLANFRDPVDSPGQPWPVQIAALLFDEKGKRRGTLDIIIKPECPIAPEAQAVHGLDADMCDAFGFSALVGVNMFFRLLSRADMIVAHNIEFDKLIMRAASLRSGFSTADLFTPKQSFCTMAKSKEICRVPATQKMLARGMKGFKVPSLDEAYQHFFKKTFTDAHTALADAEACAEIFWELVNNHGFRLGDVEDRSPTNVRRSDENVQCENRAAS